jgi:predicted NAD/FAD-binding protein
VQAQGLPPESFDRVVLAVHSDQALAMLTDPSPAEREILGGIPYQPNLAVLHTDTSQLPHHNRAWSSWNYHIPRHGSGRVSLTYDMNILQGLNAPLEFCVTLNPSQPIDARTILARMDYHHPVYTAHGTLMQKRHEEVNGVNRTYFCGAYWGYGFHEDGVNSALAVGRHFDEDL